MFLAKFYNICALSILVFGFSNLTIVTLANQLPTTADSNVKISNESFYQVNWSMILENYKGNNKPSYIEIVELPIHGELLGEILNSHNNYVENGFLFEYSPSFNFQGADHFKYRVFDGENFSNTSSFNFDILPYNQEDKIVCVDSVNVDRQDDRIDEDGIDEGGNFENIQSVSTNNFGNQDASLASFVGTGGGGDSLKSIQESIKPVLIRTGGFGLD